MVQIAPMLLDTILRSEALKKIDAGETFSLAFVTADRRRGTGGRYIIVDGWRRVQGTAAQLMPAQQTLTTAAQPARGGGKNPHHGTNKTFNIHNPRNPHAHIYKVHYRLFTRFNGKLVIQ